MLLSIELLPPYNCTLWVKLPISMVMGSSLQPSSLEHPSKIFLNKNPVLELASPASLQQNLRPARWPSIMDKANPWCIKDTTFLTTRSSGMEQIHWSPSLTQNYTDSTKLALYTLTGGGGGWGGGSNEVCLPILKLSGAMSWQLMRHHLWASAGELCNFLENVLLKSKGYQQCPYLWLEHTLHR